MAATADDSRPRLKRNVWDRFDFFREYWETSPWNPGNNVNYSYDQTGFAPRYPDHPSRDRQPFFHSIPSMPHYKKKLDLVRRTPERFVAKMLSYSLEYGHVLYCMNNETSTPAQWGHYWIDFIQGKAAEKGVTVCATDMFDDAFEGEKAKHTPLIGYHRPQLSDRRLPLDEGHDPRRTYGDTFRPVQGRLGSDAR